jgi:hypothetical protein
VPQAVLEISGIALSRLRDFLAGQIGLHFTKERSRELERGIRAAAIEFGYADAEAFIDWLVSTPLSVPQIESLAGTRAVFRRLRRRSFPNSSGRAGAPGSA